MSKSAEFKTPPDNLPNLHNRRHQIIRGAVASVALAGAGIGISEALTPSSPEHASQAVTVMTKFFDTLKQDGKTLPSKSGNNSVTSSLIPVENARSTFAYPIVIETSGDTYYFAFSPKVLDVNKQTSAELAEDMVYEKVELTSLMPTNPNEGALVPVELNKEGIMVGKLDNGTQFMAGYSVKDPHILNHNLPNQQLPGSGSTFHS